MTDSNSAEALKQEGNIHFKNGNFLKAAGLYTKAIREDPENVILYSNRCAALLRLSKMTKAQIDADKVISMRPEWEKGYFRKASIYEAQEQYNEALKWYKRASECENVSPDVELKIRNLTRLIKSTTKGNASTSSTNSNGKTTKNKGSNFTFQKG